MNFRIGQNVVCVHVFTELIGCNVWPIKGQIYTVRGFNRDCFLFLDEVVNPLYHYAEGFLEAAWNPRKFRAVAERKTDISIFTEMLKPRDLVRLND